MKSTGCDFFCKLVPSQEVHFLEHSIILPVSFVRTIHLLKHSEIKHERWGCFYSVYKTSSYQRAPELYLSDVILNHFSLSNTLSETLVLESLPWRPGILYIALSNAINIMVVPTPQTEQNFKLHRKNPILTHCIWTVMYHGLNYVWLKTHIPVELKALHLPFRPKE